MSIINAEGDMIAQSGINQTKREDSVTTSLKMNRACSGDGVDFFFNNNTHELLTEDKNENQAEEIPEAYEAKDRIQNILSQLYKVYQLNKSTKENLVKKYEDLSRRQTMIEQTLDKIKRVNKIKQKKHVKYLRYIPLNKIYFYSPKKNHFYYILMDIVVKSRKKQSLGMDEEEADHSERKSVISNGKKSSGGKKKSEFMNKSTLKRNLNRYKFKEEEDEILKKLILYSGGAYVDWNQISRDFNDFVTNVLHMEGKQQFRSALECYTRSLEISDFYTYKKWTNEEDQILRKAILYYGPKNWQQISYCLEGRNNSQAFHRWMKGINPKIKRSKWSFEEDLTLGIALKIYGNKKWSKIANHLGGRTDIQCRERFCNILDPSLEEVEWKPHEDAKLLMLYDQMKNKWSKIAKEFGNRTDNTCWRRWKYLESLRKGMQVNHSYNNTLTNGTQLLDSQSDYTYNQPSNTKTASKKKQKKKEIFKVRKVSRDISDITLVG